MGGSDITHIGRAMLTQYGVKTTWCVYGLVLARDDRRTCKMNIRSAGGNIQIRRENQIVKYNFIPYITFLILSVNSDEIYVTTEELGFS